MAYSTETFKIYNKEIFCARIENTIKGNSTELNTINATKMLSILQTPAKYKHIINNIIHFEGACINISTAKRVCETAQARPYCNQVSKQWRLHLSNALIRFGDRTHKTRETMEVSITVTKDAYIPIIAVVFDVDIALLLGLKDLRVDYC